MKKFILLSAVAVCLAITSCNNTKTDDQADTGVVEEQVVDTTQDSDAETPATDAVAPETENTEDAQ